MKKKILTYYVILITVAITFAGFFISHVTRNIYKNEIENFLLTSTRLIAHQIDLNGPEKDYRSLATTYSKILSTGRSGTDNLDVRITFIDFSGMVLGESDADPALMENHLTRKEVSDAISGKYGRDIRISKTTGLKLLYVAAPYEADNMVIRISVPLACLSTINRNILGYTIISITVGLLLTILLAIKFTSLVIAPVNKLIDVSSDIAQGNYSRRVQISNNDELGKLALTFNRMAEELENKVKDLTERNKKINSILNSMNDGIIALDQNQKITFINTAMAQMFDIPEQESEWAGGNIIEVIRNAQLNRLIEETYQDNMPKSGEIKTGYPESKFMRVFTNPLHSIHTPDRISGVIVTLQDVTNIIKLERIRTEFVSNVTHELKTPLTSIRGFIETLRAGALYDKDVAEQFLDIIDIEADRLYTLINDIMQLSEIESGKKDIQISDYNLRALFLDILPVLEKVAEQKKVQIHEQIDPAIHIKANQNRIKQLFMNLVDNAIKYNIENGQVWVNAYRSEGMVVIKVKDNGIGIPEEHHKRIYERFYRVDKGRSRNLGGTGLGLSIIKHIVNLYNGDIRLISKPNEGTEFIIRLPL